jgi:hypothetical protein
MLNSRQWTDPERLPKSGNTSMARFNSNVI